MEPDLPGLSWLVIAFQFPKPAAGPATGSPPGCGKRSRRSQSGDRSAGLPRRGSDGTNAPQALPPLTGQVMATAVRVVCCVAGTAVIYWWDARAARLRFLSRGLITQPGPARADSSSGLVRRLLGHRVGVLDGDPGAFLFDHGDRDADLEDSLVVPGRDVRGVDPGGEPDLAGERSVAELRAIRPVVLLAALGADGQDPAVDGDLDVVLRVQAGQFSPDHIAVVPDRFLEPEHLACQERRRSCPRGLQPVGQVREHGAEPRGRLRARQLSHDVPPLNVRPCYLFWPSWPRRLSRLCRLFPRLRPGWLHGPCLLLRPGWRRGCGVPVGGSWRRGSGVPVGGDRQRGSGVPVGGDRQRGCGVPAGGSWRRRSSWGS